MRLPSRFRFILCFLPALLLLGALVFTPADAAAKKKPPAPPDPRILISKVDLKNSQVSFIYKRNKGTKTYVIDSNTAVTVSGAPGKISDIKAGLQVTDYVERDNDTLQSITVDTAEPAPVAPKN